MSVTIKLALSYLRVHKIRAALTISAIALSVSLVVAVTSSYSSVYAAAHRSLQLFMGSADAQILRRDDLHGGIDSNLIAQLEADSDVYRVDGRLEVMGNIMDAAGQMRYSYIPIVGVSRPHDVGIEAQRLEQGRWFNNSVDPETVIDQITADDLKLKIGDTIVLPLMDRQLKLTIVGIVHKPKLLASSARVVYAPLELVQKLVRPDKPNQVSRIMIDLVPGTDEKAFAARWQPKLTAIDSNLVVQLTSDARKKIEDGLQGVHALSYLGGSVAFMAATFIIFSALSMGVTERQRSLAMLRAIGAERMQLAILVIAEGLALAIAGIAIGIPLGILWINILAWLFPAILTAGAAVSMDGTLFAVAGSLLTALLASLLPAFTAARASPLEAMSPLARPERSTSGILVSMIAAAVLLAIDPIILSGPLDRSIQFYLHFSIGVAATMFGFFLIAPLLVKLVEFIFAPIVAPMLGVKTTLLRQQFSTGVWRAAGTCAAMMVGLAILIVTQIQGRSAIHSWKLPTRFPDLMIYSQAGLNQADQEKLSHTPGFRPEEFMPIAVASPEFGSSIFAIAGAVLLPNATMFFGIDPDKARAMIDLDFREGNADTAWNQLKLGQHLIVTEEYRQAKGLHVGDKLALKTNKGTVEFTIAGVVWSPGIDVITSVNDLGRQFSQRTAASVFGTTDDAREYFGVDSMHFFAANIQTGLNKDKLMAQINRELGKKGLDMGDVRELKHRIEQSLYQLLLLVSTVAYAAMAVASLGVTNTIMASIRSRRWHFGILRSIGVTRGQLLRLVLAEAVLLGLAAIVLGSAAGADLTIDARHAWRIFFGFVPDVIVIPWPAIGIGMGVVMFVSLLASAWPAIHLARTEPLSLLQAGRAAV